MNTKNYSIVFKNKHSERCTLCGGIVLPTRGTVEKIMGHWYVTHQTEPEPKGEKMNAQPISNKTLYRAYAQACAVTYTNLYRDNDPEAFLFFDFRNQQFSDSLSSDTADTEILVETLRQDDYGESSTDRVDLEALSSAVEDMLFDQLMTGATGASERLEAILTINQYLSITPTDEWEEKIPQYIQEVMGV